jgi:hypothetical protein
MKKNSTRNPELLYREATGKQGICCQNIGSPLKSMLPEFLLLSSVINRLKKTKQKQITLKVPVFCFLTSILEFVEAKQFLKRLSVFCFWLLSRIAKC